MDGPNRSEIPDDCAGRSARDRTEALVRFLERATDPADGPRAFDLLFEELAGVIPFNRIGLARVREERNAVVCEWARSDRPMHLAPDFQVRLDRTSLERVLRERSPRIIGNLEEYLERNPRSESTDLIVREGMRSSLTCPLVAGRDGAVGFLFFSSVDKHAYGDADAALLRQFGGLLARSLLQNGHRPVGPALRDPATDDRRRSSAGEPDLSRTDLARFFELSLDLLCIAGTDGHFKTVNPSFTRVLGYSPEELRASPFLDFVHPDDRSATIKVVAKLKSGRPVLRFENRYRCKDGSYLWLEWNTMPVAGEDTIYAIARDITRHKEVDLRLQTVVESSPDGILLVDAAGRIRLANAAAERMFGCARAEMLWKPLEFLLPERYREAHGRHRKTFLQEGRERHMGEATTELTGLSSDGREFPVDIALKPIEIDGEAFVISTIRDLTERKRAEREILIAREVQQALLPSTLPSVPGFDIAARSLSAEPTCGDFFDFVIDAGGAFVVAVGDVSGHGLGPAILTASIMSYLRAFARSEIPLGGILARTSDLLHGETRPEDFATVLLARIHPGARILEYSNAGHPPAWIVGRNGLVKRELGGTGVPLGMFARAEYPSATPALLQPGDAVVVITDGILEAESPQGASFGTERVLGVLRETRAESAVETLEALHREVRRFTRTDRRVDDMTTLVIKVEDEWPEPPPPACSSG